MDVGQVLNKEIRTQIGEMTIQGINAQITINQLKQEVLELKQALAVYEPVADTEEDK